MKSWPAEGANFFPALAVEGGITCDEDNRELARRSLPAAGVNFFDSLFRLTIYGKTMVMHQDFLVKTGYPPIYMKNIFAFFKKGRELILGPKKGFPF